MTIKQTIHSHYHISLEDEINRILEAVRKMGIKNPTKLEITALIAEKNRKASMTTLQLKEFFQRIRGLK